ncbi:SET domain-containing protein SmydA-8-like [Harmonia axyridis]|uniref:SET domain-containing protein SmydA-8-like n=1 Tax=Harmonia axyridis TaxID=115357 RepID=UPI001E275185|nr:SET domain-containing protein SmydA-8-like [Harmonia axyridis]
MGENKCSVCQEKADLKCSGCKLVWYCGKDHQKKHWKEHKGLCRPFNIEEDEGLGKCLVATRDLSPGDLILVEHPLVYGPRPHMVEEGPVPCPGCCRLIIGEKSPRCPNCEFPVCDPACSGLDDMEKHGHECMILGLRDISAINGLHDFYRQDALLALRCLLLQKRHPKKYAQLMDMEGHLERRGRGTDAYDDVQNRIFNYLDDNFFRPLKCMEMKTGKNILPDTAKETIHKICGIIDVNALEINQDAEISALYPTAYLMEHNCVPNTYHSFQNVSDGYKITIRAALPIKKGDHISTMYTHALWGTQARREHLKETKYFSCSCKRCSDPTELGTYFSAFLCMGTSEKSCDGFHQPIDPLDDNTEWSCNKCDVKLTNNEIAFLVNKIGEEVDNVQLSSPTVRELDALLTKMSTFLHPNHYHCYAVKHSLIQLYGYQQGYMPAQLTDETLTKKANMCRELLNVTKKLDPGNSRLPLYTGVILHELHLANMIAIKRKWDVGMKTRVKGIITLLQECNQCLIEAKEVLRNEFTTPPGEKLNKLIATSTQEFNRWIERNKIDLKK